jgi:hypothetical protein
MTASRTAKPISDLDALAAYDQAQHHQHPPKRRKTR